MVQQVQMMLTQARARTRTAWGWWCPRARARRWRSAAQRLACRLSPAKSQTASRSCLSAAQRKVTARTLPDWRVEGVTPARQASESAVGKRPRASPISVSSRAARTQPERGRLVKIGVPVELLGDPGGEDLDLSGDGAQHGHERGGDDGGGVTGGAGGAGRGLAQAGVQGVGQGAPAVAHRGQPGSPSLGREPVGAILGGEAFQEPQADVGVDLGERSDRAGEADLQMRAQLVGYRELVGDQIAAGGHGVAQRDGGCGVDDQGRNRRWSVRTTSART